MNEMDDAKACTEKAYHGRRDQGQCEVGITDELRRASLRERVEGQRNQAMREAGRAARLQELAYLMDKYPEIARMLDLLDEVRG